MRRARREPVLSPRLLGAALVVELAVWVLLEVIRRLVGKRLYPRVTNVWIAGRQLVQNTQALHTLNATQRRSAELVEELERQQQPAGGRTA
ncbi:MAG TPA: hypothetical protein VG474_11865 [Solirubrobacteraceae bacterium]|nr:hypothetical protein [Solirubrobacteraceae bacterium]